MGERTWYEVYCPHCETVNWICDGNTSDLTQPDIEAVRCHKCAKAFWLGDEETQRDITGHNTPEDALCEVGEEDRRTQALQDVLELIEREKNEDYIGAEKHIANTGGVIWTIREPICFYNSLQAKVRAKIEEA